MLGLELEGRLRDLALGVLDRLRLVEDDGVPGLLLLALQRRGAAQALALAPEERVGREGHVGAWRELAPRPVVAVDLELRAEAAELVGPSVENARRHDDQRRRPPLQGAEGLERLAEAHVVGEERPEPGPAEEREPADARLLIVAQRRPQVLRQLGRRQPGEVLGQRPQSAEIRVDRAIVEIHRELGEGRPSPGLQRPVGAAGREEKGQVGAVALEPVHRQRREPACPEGHERLTALPGLDDPPGVDLSAPSAGACLTTLGTLVLALADGEEGDPRPRSVADDPREQGADAEELLMTAAADLAERRQPLPDRHRLLAGEDLRPPRRHLELKAEPRPQALLGDAIALREDLAEGHQALPVDPGDRGLAVDDRRQDRQAVPLPTCIKGQPRPERRLLVGQPLAADVDRRVLLEVGDDVADEADHLLARVDDPLLEAEHLVALEADDAGGPQRIAAEHRAVLEELGDLRVADQRDPDAVAVAIVGDLDVRSHRRAADLDRHPVELDVRRALALRGEVREDHPHHLGRQDAALKPAQHHLDRHVRRRRQESARSLDPAAAVGGEAVVERILAGLVALAAD